MTSGQVNEDYPLEFAKSPIPKMMNQTRNVARDAGLGFSQTLNSQSFTRTIKDFEVGQSASKGILDTSQSQPQYQIEEPDFNIDKSVVGKETMNLLQGAAGSGIFNGNTSASRIKRVSRNANAFNLTKVLTDNPKFSQVRALESYQRDLDSKLAQPKLRSPHRSPGLYQQVETPMRNLYATQTQGFTSSSQGGAGVSQIYKQGTASMLSDYIQPNSEMLPPTVKKQQIKLRKINQQEKEVIFKDYYDRKRELSPLKYSSKNLFGKMTATSTNLGMT